MLGEEVGSTETFLVFKVVGDDGFPCPECIARWRCQIGAYRCHPDNAFVPTDSSDDLQAIAFRNMTKNLAEPHTQPLCRETCRVLQQFVQCCTLQRLNSKIREDLLLSHALPQPT